MGLNRIISVQIINNYIPLPSDVIPTRGNYAKMLNVALKKQSRHPGSVINLKSAPRSYTTIKVCQGSKTLLQMEFNEYIMRSMITRKGTTERVVEYTTRGILHCSNFYVNQINIKMKTYQHINGVVYLNAVVNRGMCIAKLYKIENRKRCLRQHWTFDEKYVFNHSLQYGEIKRFSHKGNLTKHYVVIEGHKLDYTNKKLSQKDKFVLSLKHHELFWLPNDTQNN